MKKQTKIIICVIALVAALIVFNLQIFVFEAPDGVVGFLLCLVCVELIIGSVIKLYQLSSRFKNTVLALVNFLFSIE